MYFQDAVKLMKRGIECRPKHWEKGMTQTLDDEDSKYAEFSLQDIESRDWEAYDNLSNKIRKDALLKDDVKEAIRKFIVALDELDWGDSVENMAEEIFGKELV